MSEVPNPGGDSYGGVELLQSQYIKDNFLLLNAILNPSLDSKPPEIAAGHSWPILPGNIDSRLELGTHNVPLGHNADFLIPRYKGDTLELVLGDVVGHDHPASVMAGIASTAFEESMRKNLSPYETTMAVNRFFIHTTRQIPNMEHMYVSAIYVQLDLKYRIAEIVRAGHPLPMVFSKEGVYKPLARDIGLQLNIDENPPLHQMYVQLDQGDSLFLLTDGITEAPPKNLVSLVGEQLMEVTYDPFGESRVQSLISHHLKKGNSVQEICEIVIEDSLKFQGQETGARFNSFDDASIVGVRFL